MKAKIFMLAALLALSPAIVMAETREYFRGFQRPANSQQEFRQRIDWLQRNYPYEDDAGRRYRFPGQASVGSANAQTAKVAAANACVNRLIRNGTLQSAQRASGYDQTSTIAYNFQFLTQAGLVRQHLGYVYLEPRQGRWVARVVNIDGRDIPVN